MLLKKILGSVFIICCAFSELANANTIGYNFTGTVTYSDLSLNTAVNSPITGSFYYDVNSPVSVLYSAPPTEFTLFNFNAPNALAINFNGHSITSDTLIYSLRDNSGGNVEDLFNLNAYNIKFDNTYSGANFSLYLGSQSGSSDALTNGLPPKTLNLALFNQNSFNYGDYVSPDGNTQLQFSINTISPAPEPESYAMLLVGLGVLVIKRRRKNQPTLMD